MSESILLSKGKPKRKIGPNYVSFLSCIGPGRIENLLFHFSDPSKKMLSKFLHVNSPVKTLTNLRLDCFWSMTKRVTKLKAHL